MLGGGKKSCAGRGAPENPIARLRLYKDFPALYRHTLSKQQQRLVRSSLTAGQKSFLLDAINNFRHNNPHLSPTQRKLLLKHKTKLRVCCSPNLSQKQKLRLLGQPQYGGFVSALLSLLAVILPPIIGKFSSPVGQ